MIKGFKRSLIAVVLGFSSFLSGCVSGLTEGEVVRMEYVPYKAGTPLVSYPPAVALATIILNLATTQRERHWVYVEEYNPEKDCGLRKRENVDGRAYYQIREGDWFIYARDKRVYDGILDSTRGFESQENR